MKKRLLLILAGIYGTMTQISGVMADAPTPPPPLNSSLITQYLPLGDIAGFTIATYTEVMGTIFFALILMPPVIGAYIRGGVMPSIIIMFLLWGTVYAVFPGLGLNLVLIMLVLAVGLYIARLFLGRRATV